MRQTLARYLCLGFLGLTAGTAWLTLTRAEQPSQAHTRREFMRQKLEFSKDVLEGLSLEQFATIERSAKALKKLSEASEWEVPTIPNATDYVAITTEFQRSCDDLLKQAKARNIDGATLSYLKLTMTCVQCHKFVRFSNK
jgi:hypothetical protein